MSITSNVSRAASRKLVQAILFTGLSVLLVWILKQAFPKNAGALNLFLILLLLDAFLWTVSRSGIRSLPFRLYIPLAILYWLPFLLVIAGTAYGFFHSYYAWPPFVKTNLINLVFIAYIAKAIPAVCILTGIIFGGIRLILFRKPAANNRIRVSRFCLITGWTAGGIVFLVLLSGMVWWQHHFKVRTVEITAENLPASFDGLRIAQISDLHLGSWTDPEKLMELIDLINETHPDLVCFTGDLCNYDTDEAWPFRDILARIRAPDGVYAILGNHDYGDYRPWPSLEIKQQNMQDLKRFYREIDWKLLCNENHILVRHKISPDSTGQPSDTIALLGVENWGSLSRFQRLADLPATLKGVETVPFTLLLSHDPTHWDSIVSREYPEISLTLAGHTHGGQIGFEAGKTRWSFVSSLYPHWAGLYRKDHPGKLPQYLYVNRGAGTIGYSGRIGIWAEITLIILRSNKPVSQSPGKPE